MMKPPFRSALVAFLVVLGALAGICEPRLAAMAAPAGVATATPCIPPSAPTLVAPADQAIFPPTNFIMFDWDDVPGATRYQLAIDDNPDFSSLPGTSLTPQSSFTLNYRLPPGTYYWRARGIRDTCEALGLWSLTRSFTICAPPPAPGLISPADQAVVAPTNILLDWGDVAGYPQYQLQIDDDPAFGSPQLAVPINGSRWEIRSGDLAPGIYYWRARVYGSCPSDWSAARRFTICDPPATPGLIAPADQAVVAPTNILLDWGDVSGTTQYLFQVDDDPAFGSPQFAAPPSSQWNIESLAPGSYYWRARVYLGSCAGSDWSETRRFQVATPATPEPTATNTPTVTPTPPPTDTPTATPLPPTDTPTATPVPAATNTPTATPVPAATNTPTASPTLATGTPTASPTATSTPTPVPPARATTSLLSCWPALLAGLVVVVGSLSVLAWLRRRRRPGE